MKRYTKFGQINHNYLDLHTEKISLMKIYILNNEMNLQRYDQREFSNIHLELHIFNRFTLMCGST